MPRRLIVTLLASALLGVPADQVPDIAGLLYGPLLNGTRVSLR